MNARILKLIFKDGTATTADLGRHDALSDWFVNRGIDLDARTTDIKQILFLGDGRLSWEDITTDWIE